MSVIDDFLNKGQEKAQEYITIIEDMLNDYDSYHYAEQTLADILQDVEENGRITPRQIKAVENIRRKPSHESY